MNNFYQVGDLVRPSSAWCDELSSVELFNEPGALNSVRLGSHDRVIGLLRFFDVALVVFVNPNDDGSLYIIGPNGGGWTFSACLLKV